MADKNLEQLNSITSISDTDLLHVRKVSSHRDKKITWSSFKSLILSLLNITSVASGIVVDGDIESVGDLKIGGQLIMEGGLATNDIAYGSTTYRNIKPNANVDSNTDVYVTAGKVRVFAGGSTKLNIGGITSSGAATIGVNILVNGVSQDTFSMSVGTSTTEQESGTITFEANDLIEVQLKRTLGTGDCNLNIQSILMDEDSSLQTIFDEMARQYAYVYPYV